MKKYRLSDISYHIMIASQLACALEVSAYPKPGNVHRLRDFEDTRYEHFLAGSIALGPHIKLSVSRGMKVGRKLLKYEDIELGRLIRQGIKTIHSWHKGGNTHLGIATLFIPLASAFGITYSKMRSLELEDIREEFDMIVRSSTVEDAIEYYRAIQIAKPGGLGEVKKYPSIYDSDFERRLKRDGLTLYDLMKISSKWDMIAREFINRLELSIKIGYPTFIRLYNKYRDINIATVHIYLYLLSRYPDTFVARKSGRGYGEEPYVAFKKGLNKALDISRIAKNALEKGGLTTETGRNVIEKLDHELYIKKLNPGSTADLVATILFVALVKGLEI